MFEDYCVFLEFLFTFLGRVSGYTPAPTLLYTVRYPRLHTRIDAAVYRET